MIPGIIRIAAKILASDELLIVTDHEAFLAIGHLTTADVILLSIVISVGYLGLADASGNRILLPLPVPSSLGRS